MQIRKTTINDLDTVMNIYAYAREFMAAHGNPNQWGPTNWPPRDLIINDINVQKGYVCVDDNDTILGAFYYDCGKDIEETYRIIEGGESLSGESLPGEWPGGNNSYGVVHRIAVAPDTKGIGSFCINWAFEQCGDLRIDTHTDNYVMQNLLNKLGFKKCGIIHVVEDNYPRFAYEKI